MGWLRLRRLTACGLPLALVLGAQLGVATTAAAAGPPAQVRINQVGYPSGLPKRAYLLAPVAESGATFSIRRSGHVVLSIPIGADHGSWSAIYPHVYVLDFDAVTAAGSYTIVVSGPAPAHSMTFRIDSAANLFGHAEVNALSFFQNERDGAQFIRSALRTAPGHLNDAHAMTYLPPNLDVNDNLVGDLQPLGVRIDASGAWWDAGDYPKFVETTTYTVAMMLVGIRDFPRQLGPGSPADFTAEAVFGLDWLSRMWRDDSRTLYYQVGITGGNATTIGDHDIWRLPQADDAYGGSDPAARYIRNRPVFRSGPAGSKISPNLAGRLSAAFALCSQVFSESRPELAERCLRSGEHVFDLANTNPSGDLLTTSPFGAYPETEWRDDLEMGATELAIALQHEDRARSLPPTDASHYLRLAAHWAHAYITGPNDAADTLNLYDVSAQAHFDLSRAIARADDPSGLEVTRAALLADLAKQLALAESFAASDPFGFGFPWAAFDTTSHGAGISVMASEYDFLTHGTRYRADGVRWLGNILGANAWGTSLIVGDGAVFPFCMQHQVTNLVGSLNGLPPILAGAAVEGPNTFAASGTVDGMKACPPGRGDRFAKFNGSGAVYQDNVESWSTVEPAIDLTITSPLAFAWLAA